MLTPICPWGLGKTKQNTPSPLVGEGWGEGSKKSGAKQINLSPFSKGGLRGIMIVCFKYNLPFPSLRKRGKKIFILMVRTAHPTPLRTG